MKIEKLSKQSAILKTSQVNLKV